MWMLSRASCHLGRASRRAGRAGACSRPTVNAELEPMPLRAGRSPSWCISRPRSKSQVPQHLAHHGMADVIDRLQVSILR